MKRIVNLLKAALYIALDLAAYICSAFADIPPRLWLISERGFDARDNGYWFYKYLTENHTEIHPVYVISRDSADFSRIEALGEWVEYGSWKHRLYMMSAEVLISTHDCGYAPDSVIYHHLRKMRLFSPRGKTVFLQHGVSDKEIKWYFRSECRPDLFITVGEEEAELITKIHGQPENVVVQTGFPRFDSLDNDLEEDLVLLMPTWRQFLVGLDEDEFLRSDYYCQLTSLLKDERLARLLEANGFKLVFYPHIEMQRFFEAACGGACASMRTDDVQTLLKRCKILITDYSSVYFDAAYMDKKILFFQFDRERFEGEHYKKCLIDHSRFGRICRTREELIEGLKDAVKGVGDWKNDQKEFFRYHDRNNCKRVFEAIGDLLH